MPTLTTVARFSAVLLGLSALHAMAQTPAALPSPKFHEWAPTPPMGWNSWDCFGAGVTEPEVLANADYMEKNLKSHDWNTITVDIQWYEPLAHTDRYRRGAVLEMDENGRLLPAGKRFPTTKDAHSFKPLADALHAKGLKFGLHLLRGIPRQAVDRNVPILGADVHAADIADKKSVCRWNGDMYGVDMTKPGAQEYYDSVFALLASWDVDLVKVDDLSAPYHKAEIEAIRKAIDKSGRAIIFSTSPGATPVSQGEHIQMNANMWRISDDFWDDWRTLYSQFARLHSWTPYRDPGHFPDADMLPLGNIRAWQDNNNRTRFTRDEQVTLMTLWSIARSPLIIGANMPKNDDFTLSLLTNDEVVEVDQHSTNNKQIYNRENHIVWTADVADSKDKYLAVFNASPAPVGGGRGGSVAPPPATPPTAIDRTAAQPANISISLADIGFSGPCKVRDLWAHKDLGSVKDSISATVNSHGAVLYRVQPEN
jgi:alpha-galactosidase